MKFFSIFGELNLKITDSFLKKVADMIGSYVFVWLIMEIIFWFILSAWDLIVWIIYSVGSSFDPAFGITPPSSAPFINLKSFINGFTLFMYFPNWFRIILMSYISIAVISIPVTILVYSYYSYKNSESDSFLRKEFKINCIECKEEIRVPGDWLNGKADIRCLKCEALMTLTLENGEFKSLFLKQASKYPQFYLSLL